MSSVSEITNYRPARSISYARGAAWLAWGVTVVGIGCALVLVHLNNLPWIRLAEEFILACVVGSLAWVTVGALIVSYHPRHPIGWLFCLAGLGFSLTLVLQQYTRYALVTHPNALPYSMVMAWFNFWWFIPVIESMIFLLPLLFPDGRLPSSRWRPALWITLAAILISTVGAAFRAGPVDASMPEVNNPFAPPELQPLISLLNVVGTVLTLISVATALAAPVVRMRRAQGIERQQLKWFAYGSAVLVASFVIPIALAWPNFTDSTTLNGITLSFGFVFLPVTVGVAILRHRLYDIDLIIQRTLVYGALTLSIVGLYIVVVGYLGFIFGIGSNLPISLVATGLVAVIFQPLRDWLQQRVTRLLYGERSEPYTVLSRLGQRLEAALDPGDVLLTVVATVKDALKLPYTAVALEHDGDFVVAAAEGAAVGEPLHLPLSYQGKAIGQLIVSPRVSGDNWTEAERRLLNDLAHQAGIAVHGVRVMAELQHARERLVLAREEERRRLRRGLHDDLAPALAAFALTASTASDLVATDPTAAAEAITKLHRSIRGTIGDVRRLVYDLRPPTLDELGLLEAIRELANRYSLFDKDQRLQVMLEVPDSLPALPAAVEVAVYRIIQESLINITRHAHAQTCLIRLACLDQKRLTLKVLDNGVGLPADHCVGVGISSMRERAAELGGTCEITRAAPRGTQVTASIPIVASY